ncbi:MAG: putative Na+/H+ antiporter [Desulfobacterales bacterium]|nr:putative Na+/H+ antiporter [Desulfobacterales bacterium]
MNQGKTVIVLLALIIIAGGLLKLASTASPQLWGGKEFPRDLQSYNDRQIESIAGRLVARAKAQPFNVVATLIFFLAIVHTFLSSKFMAIAHRLEHEHEERQARGEVPEKSVSHSAELFHFLGEVEAIFGIWAIALVGAIVVFFDWSTAKYYLSERVNYTEPLFVVVVMTLAATRPILRLSELLMQKIANRLGGSLTAWWFTILTFGPILGSFITEPAAMTISAILLGKKFYELDPPENFKYATLGLLFVNISVGGTLTHFAAPPVLMVASPWDWGMIFMFKQFGWKAVEGILIANGLYYLMYRKHLRALEEKFQFRRVKDEIRTTHLCRNEMEEEFEKVIETIDDELQFQKTFENQAEEVTRRVQEHLEPQYLEKVTASGVSRDLAHKAFMRRFEEVKRAQLREAIPMVLPEDQRAPYADPDWDEREDPVPVWVTAIHIFFLAWTIFTAHYPALFIPGMLFFLGFAQVTWPYQNRVNLKPALLVGFFLGGLVIHGGVQGWWIEPVLGSLSEVPLMLGATILTAFNDNAAITFLATLVPDFSEGLKYVVVAGAVAGGGLTVIANAPNPAGQSILKKYFKDGVSPAGLLKGALLPTIVVWLVFYIFKF